MNEGRAAQPGRLRTYLPGGRAGLPKAPRPPARQAPHVRARRGGPGRRGEPGRLLGRPVHRRRLRLRQLQQPVRLHHGQAEPEVGDHRLGGLDPAARRPGLREGHRPEDQDRHLRRRRERVQLLPDQDGAVQPGRLGLAGRGVHRRRQLGLVGLAVRHRRPGPAEQGHQEPGAGRHPERLRHRLPRRVHGQRLRVLPAQRPRAERALVQQDADGQVGLPGPHHLGAVPGPGGQGRQGHTPGTSSARPGTPGRPRSTCGARSARPAR